MNKHLLLALAGLDKLQDYTNRIELHGKFRERVEIRAELNGHLLGIRECIRQAMREEP